jgi:hypothetical protein
MRLTIIAGLVMGVALAINSALGAHARSIAAHAADIRPAYVSRADTRRDPSLVAVNESGAQNYQHDRITA